MTDQQGGLEYEDEKSSDDAVKHRDIRKIYEPDLHIIDKNNNNAKFKNNFHVKDYLNGHSPSKLLRVHHTSMEYSTQLNTEDRINIQKAM